MIWLPNLGWCLKNRFGFRISAGVLILVPNLGCCYSWRYHYDVFWVFFWPWEQDLANFAKHRLSAGVWSLASNLGWWYYQYYKLTQFSESYFNAESASRKNPWEIDGQRKRICMNIIHTGMIFRMIWNFLWYTRRKERQQLGGRRNDTRDQWYYSTGRSAFWLYGRLKAFRLLIIIKVISYG